MKKRMLSVFALVAVMMLSAATWTGKVGAQEKKFPSKPIDLIINFSAGGPMDMGARILLDDFSKELGVPVTLQYKPGAGGVVGASYVAAAKPDGYTLVGSVTSVISAGCLEKEATYDPLKDFTPIASYAVIPNVFATHASSRFKSFDDVVKYARENPGKITCASPGVGMTAHLILEVLRMRGVDITHVPTKGGGPAATSALGKHTDLGVFLYTAAVPYLKSGDMRILATTDKMAQEPSVPTFTEKGFPGCEGLGALAGLVGPRNVPRPVQLVLANAMKKVLQIPSVKKGLENAGYTVDFRGPEDLTKKFAADYKAIETVVKAAGLGKFAK